MLPVGGWLYALACVLLPVLWGVLMVWATRRLERFFARRRTGGAADQADEEALASSPEYHI